MITLHISDSKKAWYVVSDYEDKDTVKAAGFWWHPKNCNGRDYRNKPCKACKANVPGKSWWTPDRFKAARLAEYSADDDTRDSLADHVKSVKDSRAVDASVDIPAPDGLEYLPYQKAGIAYAMAKGSCLIGDEMGLGKTIQALGVANACEDIKSVLVVCPASLRLNWAREAQKWLVREMSVGVMSTNDMPPTDVVVTNYDRLIKKPALEALMSRKWDLLVVDEAHYAKNPDAKRTVALLGKQGKPRKKIEAKKGLVDQSERMILLTGTPLLNRPKELWSLLWGMDHKEWKSFWAFAKRYCDAHDNGWGWDVSGSSNLGELQERLRGTCMIRRLKKDVLTELPAKRRQIVPIPPNGASRLLKSEMSKSRAVNLMAEVVIARACDDQKVYEAAVAKLEAAVAKLDAAVAAEFAEMAALRKKMGVAKVPHAVEAIESAIESSGKVIAWAHHHDVIDALMDKFGDEAVSLDGRMKMEDRQRSVDRFQNDSSVKLFVGQIQAAGVGLTLTASSHEIFVEQDWTPGMMQQAEDRAHRIGQTESVLIQILVFDGSLDSYMAKMLVSKQRVADAVLDNQTALPGLAESKAKSQKRTYQVPTDEVRKAAGQAIKTIAGMCDGASTKDGHGFSRVDVSIGHSLAQRASGRPLTDGETWLACKLARKYRRQLGESITEILKLYEKASK